MPLRLTAMAMAKADDERIDLNCGHFQRYKGSGSSGQPYLTQLFGYHLTSRFNRLTFEQGIPVEKVFKEADVEAVINDAEFYRQGSCYLAGIWGGQAEHTPAGQQEVLKALADFPNGLSRDELMACDLSRDYRDRCSP